MGHGCHRRRWRAGRAVPGRAGEQRLQHHRPKQARLAQKLERIVDRTVLRGWPKLAVDLVGVADVPAQRFEERLDQRGFRVLFAQPAVSILPRAFSDRSNGRASGAVKYCGHGFSWLRKRGVAAEVRLRAYYSEIRRPRTRVAFPLSECSTTLRPLASFADRWAASVARLPRCRRAGAANQLQRTARKTAMPTPPSGFEVSPALPSARPGA